MRKRIFLVVIALALVCAAAIVPVAYAADSSLASASATKAEIGTDEVTVSTDANFAYLVMSDLVTL